MEYFHTRLTESRIRSTMLRLSGLLLAFCAFARSQVVSTSDATKTPTTVRPPSFNPYQPGRNTLLNGYNYPYYNAAGPAVPIVSYSDNRGIDGSYSYSYESADGKQVQESGFLKDSYVDNTGNPQGTQVKEGGFAYVSPEGTPIQINYVADEYGFRPAGFRIPADGKDVTPNIVDNPAYNKYTPFNYGNRYNNFGPYNGYQPYDPRYQNGFTNYPFSNQYRPFGYQSKLNVVTPKPVRN